MTRDCIEQAQQGNPEAIQLLIAGLRPRITRMAGYYARRCGMETDDLAQEAWMGLLEALPRVDVTVGVPYQYLIRRAKWRLLDALKRAIARQALQMDEGLLETVPCGDEPAGLDRLLIEEFGNRLEPKEKAILECLLGGLTWRETGERLGCTSANVAYYMRGIRRKLARWLRESGIGEPGGAWITFDRAQGARVSHRPSAARVERRRARSPIAPQEPGD